MKPKIINRMQQIPYLLRLFCSRLYVKQVLEKREYSIANTSFEESEW